MLSAASLFLSLLASEAGPRTVISSNVAPMGLVLPGVPDQETSADKVSFEEKLLLTLPEGASLTDVVISPDGRSAHYSPPLPPSKIEAGGDKKGEDYPDKSRPEVSSDGKMTAFIASKGGQTFVVVNGKRGEGFLTVQSLKLSPDGKTVMYKAKSGRNKWLMVVGEKKGPEFHDVKSYGTFSPDGTSYAYVAEDNDLKQCVVVGEKKGPAFPYIFGPTFSPDGTRLAYEAESGDWSKGTRKSFIVVGEEKYTADFDYLSGFLFAPDGKLFYVGNRGGEFLKTLFNVPTAPPRGGKWILGVDRDEFEIPPEVEEIVWPLQFSSQGKSFAYVAKTAGKEVLIFGKDVGGRYDKIRNVVFSPDGKSVLYVARQDASEFVVDGKKEGARCEKVYSLTFGPDGKTPVSTGRLSSPAGENGPVRLMIGLTTGEELPEGSYRFAISPDCSRVAHTIRTQDGMQVVVGGQKSESFQMIDPLVFSPDGKELAFGARKGREIWWKVMDVR